MTAVLAVAALLSSGADSTAHPLTGSWVYSGGPASFEEMRLSGDGEAGGFQSWLDARPMYCGSYRLSGDSLVVDADPDLELVWLVMEVEPDSLVLRRPDSEEPTVFTRLR